MKILNIVGARPNFMKMAPLFAAMQKSKYLTPYLLHTGQHYDYQMSKVFFEDLGLKEPDIYLECGGGSHATQTAKVMEAFEPILLNHSFDLVTVVGDVNSTLACALVASKLHIPVAHIEAGLRSFDQKMPEEINRIVTDRLSDYLFTTCSEGDENLKNEGIAPSQVFFVGNLMIDTLLRLLPKARLSSIHQKINCSKTYGLVTLHRPSNVDEPKTFEGILDALETLQKELPLIWPLHPRTKAAIQNQNLEKRLQAMPNLQLISPLSYLDNLCLMDKAHVVLTDSGGIQEETTVLNVPCLTLRKNTERPVTITHGTNRLVGVETSNILQGFQDISKITPQSPPLWDGKTAPRIIEILEETLR